MGEASEPKRKVRYRLYIDESGDHAYNLLDRPDHRYLALLGVWFRQDEDYVPFADDMERFKRDIFGPRPDKPVILHRSDIIGRKGPFGSLKNSSIQRRFDEELLGVIDRARFTLIVVAIDKAAHQQKYASPDHPYHYCLAAMLDRYSGYLKYKKAIGDVMAESRGKEENIQLAMAYQKVYQAGTYMFNQEHHQRALTSGAIKITKKVANIAGLQLADLLAHPVKQSMLRQKGVIHEPASAFGERLLKIAREKVNRHEFRGTVDGYGAIWL